MFRLSKHYYISGVTISLANGTRQMQIMEESEGKQQCIALVPFNPRHRDGWRLARKDALMIMKALNLLTLYEASYA